MFVQENSEHAKMTRGNSQKIGPLFSGTLFHLSVGEISYLKAKSQTEYNSHFC